MSIIASARQQWFANPGRDLLAGTVVGLALIPEAIAFSIIAGVDPAVGLYASFIIAATIAFTGGRPAMISAATGAMALLMGGLVRDHGIEYLFAASLLCGAIQIVVGLFKLGRYIRFVSKSVMSGFLNALAILIFMAQLPHLSGAGWHAYALVIASLAIIYGFPKINKTIPSPLVAIVVLSIASTLIGLDVRTVGDMGALPTTLPVFHMPAVPWTWQTLSIIAPVSLTLAFVGLMETLLTAQVLDDMTDTPSDKDRETRGQGIANIIASLFGGMAGCAMIGQSIINVTSGGRGRLSTLWAGVFLLILILVLAKWVGMIPMAALVGVMFMVSFKTFDWSSIQRLKSIPVQSTLVMVVTASVVLLTHDLSKGVIAGVLLSAIFFMRKVSKVISVTEKETPQDGVLHYRATGQLFFASADLFVAGFEFHGRPSSVTLDLQNIHIWDQTGAAALNKVLTRYRANGAQITLNGLNTSSTVLIERLGIPLEAR